LDRALDSATITAHRRVSIQIGEFRDFVVADPYGEIRGQAARSRPSPQLR
jgi:hypothetical protein